MIKGIYQKIKEIMVWFKKNSWKIVIGLFIIGLLLMYLFSGNFEIGNDDERFAKYYPLKKIGFKLTDIGFELLPISLIDTITDSRILPYLKDSRSRLFSNNISGSTNTAIGLNQAIFVKKESANGTEE